MSSKAINAQGTEVDFGVTPTAALASKVITSATNANPVEITCTGHGLVDGDIVYFENVLGMTEINDNNYMVNVTDADSFELVDVDGTSFGTFATSASSKVYKYTFNRTCEITTIDGFDGQASELDVTTLCSTGKEFRLGLQDPGNASLTVNRVFTDAAQKYVEKIKKLRLVVPVRLEFDDGSYLFVDAMVKGFSLSAGVDAVVTGTISLRLTGEIYTLAADELLP